jgi:spore coat protein JB
MNAMNERGALLRRLQAEDFALYEVALYLDGHPKCKKALAYYAEHQKLYEALKREFEEKFGPLSLYRNKNDENWDWAEGPWPWEKEAN